MIPEEDGNVVGYYCTIPWFSDYETCARVFLAIGPARNELEATQTTTIDGKAQDRERQPTKLILHTWYVASMLLNCTVA